MTRVYRSATDILVILTARFCSILYIFSRARQINNRLGANDTLSRFVGSKNIAVVRTADHAIDPLF